MLYSNLFGKTVKSIPSSIKARSHQLLYKGGFIRRISAGRYAFLPLGIRVWQKIFNVIEEEIEAIGSQRLSTPLFHPIELWTATARDKAFGDEMHVIKDHHGATFALSGTAEGMMVELVKKFDPSYRDLPILIHQYSTKFRDEKRPRGGLLRVREFMMKDAYSFDSSEEELLKSYKKFYKAYERIAKKFDLEVIPVLAHSGAIGGDYNHEFFVKSEAGESLAFVCDNCRYAAHEDVAKSDFKKYPQDKKMKKVGKHISKEATTCEKLASEMGIPLNVTTKTIFFSTDGYFVAAMVRGDYDINETKLKDFLKIDNLRLATGKEIKELTGSDVGFAGPIGLPAEVKVVSDLTCKDRVNFEVGGNETGVHLYNVNFGKDLKTPESFPDIKAPKGGDKCSECKKGKLIRLPGIEFGHVFKLDLFYSRPMGGTFTDKDGDKKPFWMGSYGIGIGRSMATIVETHNDKDGIIWPENVAPFDVHLLSIGADRRVGQQAKRVYKNLVDKGIGVLWDDRDLGPGEKLKDMDLIGIPKRAVVSDKSLKKGGVEVSLRDKKVVKVIPAKDIAGYLNFL